MDMKKKYKTPQLHVTAVRQDRLLAAQSAGKGSENDDPKEGEALSREGSIGFNYDDNNFPPVNPWDD